MSARGPLLGYRFEESGLSYPTRPTWEEAAQDAVSANCAKWESGGHELKLTRLDCRITAVYEGPDDTKRANDQAAKNPKPDA